VLADNRQHAPALTLFVSWPPLRPHNYHSLCQELVHHRRYRSRAEAEREIADYIDLFYNRQRRQARLGYLSPAAYTQLFTRQQRAA
jgi:transposase InsO family protein